jgi:hypothetical protein
VKKIRDASSVIAFRRLSPPTPPKRCSPICEPQSNL